MRILKNKTGIENAADRTDNIMGAIKSCPHGSAIIEDNAHYNGLQRLLSRKDMWDLRFSQRWL
jgi:hypothetical protein